MCRYVHKYDIYVHTYTCLNYVFAYVRENIFYAWQMKVYKTLVEKMKNALKGCQNEFKYRMHSVCPDCTGCFLNIPRDGIIIFASKNNY